METAYDPARVQQLSRRVLTCIDALGACRSDDPAAAPAMRALRLTRRNLEELWMPLVREIERSTAMTQWSSTLSPGLSAIADVAASWFRLQHRSATARHVDPAAAVLIRSLHERPWFDDVGAMVHAGAVIQQMAAIVDDPQACLDVLSDPMALYMLAEWDLLPDDLVETFVAGGLHTAVKAAPERLADGYAVLRALTTYANGPLDGGFRTGMARGVATSMSGYVTTLAPALRQEGDYPVMVKDDAAGVDIELGTYSDVVDLMGALLRDRQAQASLGVAVGGYANQMVYDLGADLLDRPGVEYVAGVADLLADAAGAEQAELVAAAAAESAKRRLIGEAIGFGVDAGLSATGAGAATRVITDQAIALATSVAARVDADDLPGNPIPPQVYDSVLISTVSMLVDEPGARGPLGVGSVDEREWNVLAEQLDRIDDADGHTERTRRFIELDSWVAANTPALAGVLSRVRSDPSMQELTEDRRRKDPDHG